MSFPSASLRSVLLLLILTGIAILAAPASAQTCPCAEAPPVIEQLVPEVIAEYPHDAGSFTQGLLLHEGTFYESAGEFGQSDVRQVAVETGEVIRKIEFTERLGEQGSEVFAEGLVLVGGQLIQLTWRNGSALVWDLATFELINVHRYETEGWGICYDGQQLFMSDGSHNLFVRDPATFRLLAMIPVTRDGAAVTNLNELECVGDHVYANVWQTNEIMRIDPATGFVDGVIDASALLQDPDLAEIDPGRAVLNGIAYNADTDTFYITGKLWPRLFEVRFVASGS
jgi:glutaminyl-peptide cyclotransferase